MSIENKTSVEIASDSPVAHQRLVSCHVPFEILVPPIAPGQEMLKKTIMVEVVGDDEIITPDSMQTLDIVKMQMMIKRLNETVRQLTGLKDEPCQPT